MRESACVSIARVPLRRKRSLSFLEVGRVQTYGKIFTSIGISEISVRYVNE